MKKILFLTLSFLFSVAVLTAQNNDALIKSIKQKIERSDKDIQNPKKNQKISTWDKRGKLFLEAYEVNIKYLAPGIAANTIPFLGLDENNTEPYYGKPLKRYQEGDKEVWEYDKVKIFVKNGVVDSWEITKPVDPDALPKAYEAFTKALSLDQDGKYSSKKSTMKNIAKLRELLKDEAINFYMAGEYQKAIDYLEKSIDLFKYPRLEEDTTANIGAYYYYAGIFAYNAGDKDKAIKYLKEAINHGFEIGTCYQYLAQVYYEKGDTATAVKELEEGAKKYPQEVKIIYSLIDYYSPRGEYDKAISYLDKAIAMTPDMAVLYFVKGDAYAKIYLNLLKKYFSQLRSGDSLSKAAFRSRMNQAEHDRLQKEADNMYAKAEETKKEADKYLNLVEEWYKKGFEKDPNFANAYIMLGNFYTDVAQENYKYGQPQRKQEIYDKYMGLFKQYLKKAIENYEKYDKLHPDDLDVLETLKSLYYKVGEKEKYAQIKKRIEEIKAKQAAENTEK